MKFKRKFDIRVLLAKIDFTFIFYLVLYNVIDIVVNNTAPFDKTSFSIQLLPFGVILGNILVGAADIFFSKKICLDNSYLYLKYKGNNPSPLEDIPIKPEDISSYSKNNPFPAFTSWCNSSKNITLFLKNGKTLIIAVKDQELYFYQWLKENFIRDENRIARRGIIETSVYTLISLTISLWFITMYKSGTLPEHGLVYLLVSAACFLYWLIYIISGLIIQSSINNNYI